MVPMTRSPQGCRHLSRLGIVRQNQIRTHLKRQGNGFRFPGAKVAHRLNGSRCANFQPFWRGHHPGSHRRRRLDLLQFCRHRLWKHNSTEERRKHITLTN